MLSEARTLDEFLTPVDAPLRNFITVCWLEAFWWGHTAYVQDVLATSRHEAEEKMREHIGETAVIRSVVAFEANPARTPT